MTHYMVVSYAPLSRVVTMALGQVLFLALALLSSAFGAEEKICGSYYTDKFRIKDCLCTVDSPFKPVSVTLLNCTNLDLSQDALSELPPSTKTLIFTGNSMTELLNNLFTQADNSLEYIDLSRNHIKTIHGRTFHKVSNVRKLILDENEWVLDDHTRVFSNFENLRFLSLNKAIVKKANSTDHILRVGWILEDSHLELLEEFQLQYNSILFTKSTTFCSLPSLRILHLSNNVIFDSQGLINAQCMRQLEEFYLHNNSLSFLNQQEIDALDVMAAKNLRILTLDDNDWRCACEGKPFIQWLQTGAGSHIVQDRNSLKCRPEEMGGTRLIDVDVDAIHCDRVSELNKSKKSTRLAISLLFSALFILIVGVIWCKRKAIRNKVRKVSIPVIARWNSGPDYQGLVSASVI
ncbi:hypothetical protein CAPTEDRAFT_210424 [Capitella teleta]|uniref:LRRCT domain-containing protein n=1 Tax=Capitella teleta TaxID=283909 RepID=N1PBC3_CAPTE|nr:hypothetical protein CAPTEDRAFT_210424 [Capitella teleta]|eukprot:ELU18940.1 hypothetical protein CAPTEDRAFT_210424 [Capitella teleta]